MISHIPVELRGADSLQGWTSTPANVTITLEGRPSLMGKFDAQRFGLRAYADMTNIFMTSAMLPVKAEIMSSDVFRIVKIEPQNITVNKVQ